MWTAWMSQVWMLRWAVLLIGLQSTQAGKQKKFHFNECSFFSMFNFENKQYLIQIYICISPFLHIDNMAQYGSSGDPIDVGFQATGIYFMVYVF